MASQCFRLLSQTRKQRGRWRTMNKHRFCPFSFAAAEVEACQNFVAECRVDRCVTLVGAVPDQWQPPRLPSHFTHQSGGALSQRFSYGNVNTQQCNSTTGKFESGAQPWLYILRNITNMPFNYIFTMTESTLIEINVC